MPRPAAEARTAKDFLEVGWPNRTVGVERPRSSLSHGVTLAAPPESELSNQLGSSQQLPARSPFAQPESWN